MDRYESLRRRISIPDISLALTLDPLAAVVQAEFDYFRELSDVSNWAIMGNRHVILLAGPSSSGKTTSAKMLTRCLQMRGKEAHYISLDDFYLNRDRLPLWPDGTTNFESIDGLDLALLRRLMDQLRREDHADFPTFDFVTGNRAAQVRPIARTADTYLVFEGLHALNPRVFSAVGGKPLRVYVSVHSDFTDAAGKVQLTARQLRLTRRIIRDTVRSSASAEVTLGLWDKVRQGEALYIAPYRASADLYLDSTHAYEPYLYNDAIQNALQACPANSPNAADAAALLAAHSSFFQMDTHLIPDVSLVQEFIHTQFGYGKSDQTKGSVLL